ncbi:MAG TPA: glycoside hydrolase family 15 protein [Chthonomonadaceae bacterium]|nr:glycoside hydrolase family 15 protein [Chthonomonadaceae bacterium]
MPRDIPIGNGRLLINFDSRYQIRDFYYPHVGDENHSAGHPFHFGVWCDGQTSWASGDDWTRSLDYLDETLVTDVHLEHKGLQLSLRCQDAVDFYETIYLRRIYLTNQADHPREVRLFFHHDFYINGFELGDTAYFNPDLNAILHYKENRYFLINCLKPDHTGMSDFAIGVKGIGGAEGTWRDAEGDGVLGRNPIAQGSVDSTLAAHLHVGPQETVECYYWICVDDRYEGVKTLNKLVLEKHPRTLLHRTAAFWKLWVNKDEYDFGPLSADILRLYKRSLLILRTQIDANGAILAANDSDITQFARDTYSYVWPRDGALVAYALDLAGYNQISTDFFLWCYKVITRYGYFLHKYNPDGSAGSSWHPWIVHGEPQLPIQEDETALVVWALWKHFDKYRDIEMVRPLYRDLIIRAGQWMTEYRTPHTGLPLPSYDLWEERRGILAWTVGATYGGLIAAANFAHSFGEEDLAVEFRDAAAHMKEGTDTYLWQAQWNRFVRMIQFDADGNCLPDPTMDASVVGLFLFGMYEADAPKIVATVEAMRQRLWIKTDVGGLARYENDYYHQVSHDLANVPGNPWFLSTLWLAQYEIAQARSVTELEEALPFLEWCVQHALPSGVLAEQVNPYNDDPLSVSPLTWSHASFVTCVIKYLDKLSSLSPCPTCGQPLYTKECRKLERDRNHYALHRMPEAVLPQAPG